MTVKELQSSRQWRQEYSCWDYDAALYSKSGVRLWWGDEGLEDDDKIDALAVVSHEPEWYLGDDGEMHKRCKIVVDIA